MSTTLPGYVQTPFGGWVKDDGSGPYLFVSGAEDEDFTQLASGFWVKKDGSGPYFYDLSTGQAVPVTGLFRSIT